VLNIKDIGRYVRRLLRTFIGKDLIIFPDVSLSKLWLGGDGGRWCVYPEGISKESIIYSVGVGEDISFDEALIDRFGVVIHAFDPTPKSVAWVERSIMPDRFVFHEIGLAHYDGDADFLPPSVSEHVSHRMIKESNSEASTRRPVRKLETIVNDLGHKNIDVLKIDIEGEEYEVITDLLQSEIRPKQFLVEFHHRFADIGLDSTKKAIESLRKEGYKVLAVSPNGEEYTFLWMP
jgi:FkbM family methyltransferase